MADQPQKPTRQQMAMIHIAKKDLGLDDDAYRAMLFDLFGVRSSKDLNVSKAGELLWNLKQKGWKPKAPKKGSTSKARGAWQGRPVPRDEIKPLIRKTIKLLSLLKKLGKGMAYFNYADGIAKKMFYRDQPNVDIKIEHLTVAQLHKVVQALEIQARRAGADVK